MNDRDSMARYLWWPVYGLAALLLAQPVLDYVTNVWPIRPGDMQWRYGSLGLLSGFLLTPVLGIVLAYAAAMALGHRVFLRVLGLFNGVAAVGLLISTVLFGLDALQLRGTLAEQSVASFDVGVVKAALKHLSVALALGWFAVAGVRASRRAGAARKVPEAKMVMSPRLASADAEE